MALIDFDRVASSYDAGRAIADSGLEGWREALGRHLSPLPELPVLDVGAGTGLFAVAIAEWFGVEVVCVEPSEAMLREAQSKHPHARVRYLDGAAERISLADASCGAAWLSTVIHHVKDLRAGAREIARVLSRAAPVLIRSSFPGRHEHITLFRFFPAARRVAETFPTVEQTIAAFAPEGFAMSALEGVPQISAPNLGAFRDRVRTRADTTLRSISDQEFEDGLRVLDEAVAADDGRRPVVDQVDLLVLSR